MSIQKIIKDYQEQQAEQAKEEAEHIAQEKDRIASEVLNVIGIHLPDILDFIDPSSWKIQVGSRVEGYVTVNVPGLSSFYACAYSGLDVTLKKNRPGTSGYSGDYLSATITNKDAVAAFLYERQQEYLKAQARERDNEIATTLIQLGAEGRCDGYVGNNNKFIKFIRTTTEPDVAEEAYKALLSLDYDATEAKTHYDAWLDRCHKQQERQRQASEEAQQREAELEHYKQEFAVAYADWMRRFIPIAQENLATLEAIKDELSVPFKIVQLERGIVAEEDGERWVDTDIVDVVLHDDGRIFDDDGMCQLLRQRRSTTERWYIDQAKVVGHSEPTEYRPGKDIGAHIDADSRFFNRNKVRFIEKYHYSARVYFSPTESRQRIEAILTERLTPPPVDYPHALEDEISFYAHEIISEIDDRLKIELINQTSK